MKRTHLLPFFIIFLLAAVALSGCVGGSAYGTTSWPGVSADDSVAYVAYNQFVYAVNLEGGSLKWRYPESGNNNMTFYAAPVLTEDGQLLVGSYNNKLYSLNAETGALNWTFEQATGRFIATPLAAGGVIYAPSADGMLYALNQNGSLRWTFEAGGPLWAQPVFDEACSCLYLSSMDHHMYAVDIENGRQVWRQDLGAAIVGTPALSEDGKLFVGTFGKEMYALQAEGGAVIWKAPTQDWVWAGPVLADDKLYFGDLRGDFYALNQADGALIWQAQPDGAVTGTPLVQDDVLYFTTQSGTIYGYSLDGEPVWQQVVDGRLNAPAASAEDLILVAPSDADGLLMALNPGGAPRWTFVPEK